MSYLFGKLCDQGISWHWKNDVRSWFKAARNFFFTPDSNRTLIWHCLLPDPPLLVQHIPWHLARLSRLCPIFCWKQQPLEFAKTVRTYNTERHDGIDTEPAQTSPDKEVSDLRKLPKQSERAPQGPSSQTFTTENSKLKITVKFWVSQAALLPKKNTNAIIHFTWVVFSTASF